jgi:hypothetical protein
VFDDMKSEISVFDDINSEIFVFDDMNSEIFVFDDMNSLLKSELLCYILLHFSAPPFFCSFDFLSVSLFRFTMEHRAA